MNEKYDNVEKTKRKKKKRRENTDLFSQNAHGLYVPI